ncbi:hypothetical protein ACFW9S_35795 [Streptomyces anulatus]|uniref:hypothetical protein n=1 Tax=Streptomyces anulatus TaxID=1892 RepID=UPI0036B5B5D1
MSSEDTSEKDFLDMTEEEYSAWEAREAKKHEEEERERDAKAGDARERSGVAILSLDVTVGQVDDERLNTVLKSAVDTCPPLKVLSAKGREVTLAGADVPHLEAVVERLKRDVEVSFTGTRPAVVYLTEGQIVEEPTMTVLIRTPADDLGTVLAEVARLQGGIEGTTEVEGGKEIEAVIPLRTMDGFTTSLHGLTRGEGSYQHKFRAYVPAPKDVAAAVISGNRWP